MIEFYPQKSIDSRNKSSLQRIIAMHDNSLLIEVWAPEWWLDKWQRRQRNERTKTSTLTRVIETRGTGHPSFEATNKT